MARYAELFVKPNDRLTSFERLEIYNQQYWWRVLEGFAEDFSGVAAVIGPKKFEALSVAYIETCGSNSWTMRNLGRDLPAFLVAHPQLTAPHTTLALDMARLEWARCLAFDEPADPVPDTQKLARTPPHELRLGLQSYITLLTLEYEAEQLLLRLRRRSQKAAGSTASNAMTSAPRRSRALRIVAKRAPAPVHLVVHRLQNTVYYKRVTPEAHVLLTLIHQGIPVEQACARAFTGSDFTPEDAASQIQQWFADWMELGWFTGRA
ncbi:DUF2063 domain-containing protein [Roseimicrobium sp. ORNL1]|nr:DUF2063 domain-containing protein [Roseimicrobium sp. ORNL1]